MRIKISISLIFVFSLLALNAYAILQPSEVRLGGEESLADKLIDASVGKVPAKNRPTPQQSRSLQENNSLVWTPMPETLSAGKTPRASRTQSQGQVNASSAALMSDTAVAGSPVGTQNPTSSNLAGTWSLELNDTPSKQVVLTLFQVEDKVFGSGSMENGNDTLVVAASGALKGDQIYLDIISVGTISLYSLVMNSSADSASGDYRAYMANGLTWEGKVQGDKSLPIY